MRKRWNTTATQKASRRESTRGSILEIVCSDIRRAAAALKLTGAFDNVRLFGDRLNVVAPEARTGEQAVRATLGEAGIDVSSCRVVPTSLENAFISLVTAERGER